ncbi:arginine--tRNA ligase [Eggerthellaceae bacterium zg-1084]|uniref:arginine--tRNA ligase n=1 Tax=Berryella wangjianweii TaxID=2734634 RepID=UPI001555B218|nr:arginine--tRNA ligase [Berryella wangjianweii]NPD30456.1 arginine--tRNA ligase [Berryella wangjianweii]
MTIREELEQLIGSALQSAVEDGTLALDQIPPAALERPRDESHGDWASTVALRCAKLARRAPRDVAQAIIDHLPQNELVESAQIAGPGFINLRLAPATLQGVVRQVRAEGADYGRGSQAQAQRINLEYVSANPTGPLHVGHGRWAVLGDAIARVMRHAGYDVSEEFYINDQGVQMNVFGNSVGVRYLQLLGHDVELPEQAYGGAYVADIAQAIIDEHGRAWEDATDEERMLAFREIAYERMLSLNREVLADFGVTFDCWFSERSLYAPDDQGRNAIARALAAMTAKGFIEQRDGATWFLSTAFGDTKDRVLVKENGEYTYFMSDMAYHLNKIERGFDHLIDLWGADHHGYIKRCEAMLEAWGHPGRLEVVLGQLVNLFRDGEAVRMSKRTGEMVTFSELIDEVGVDATRYLMLSRSSDQQIDFDIEAAKKQDASNPVYYVQYAHARICSILRRAAGGQQAAGGAVEAADAALLAARVAGPSPDLAPLTHEAELALMRKMANFPELVELAARDRAPFRLTHYAQDLAAAFHQFYTHCRIVGEDEAVMRARVALADAARIVLALTLSLMGVSAPQKM